METVIAPELESNLDEVGNNIPLGGGAVFWVYISPQNNTPGVLGSWEVTFKQGDWTGTITSKNPREHIKAPDKDGIFSVSVKGSVKPKEIVAPFPPKPPSTDKIGCGIKCGSFVGLVADPNGQWVSYWTTWNAICKM